MNQKPAQKLYCTSCNVVFFFILEDVEKHNGHKYLSFEKFANPHLEELRKDLEKRDKDFP